MPKTVGAGAACAVIMTIFDFTGGSLRGKPTESALDEFDRRELIRATRRRPLEETIAEIGEGRGRSLSGMASIPCQCLFLKDA